MSPDDSLDVASGEPPERSPDSPQHPTPARSSPADQPPTRRSSPNAVSLLGLGLANAVAVAAGLVIGRLIDDRLGTTPAFLFLGLASGIVLGVAGSYLEVRRYLGDGPQQPPKS